jgi:hypothetical protein
MRLDDSPYVFSIYSKQLRTHHLAKGTNAIAKRVNAEFNPSPFGEWLRLRIGDWSEKSGVEHAYPHAIRKTALQRARQGEDINRQVAADARLGTDVMLASYVIEGSNEHRHASNRMFRRLTHALPPHLAQRFGFENPTGKDTLEARLQVALRIKDWANVALLSSELARHPAD